MKTLLFILLIGISSISYGADRVEKIAMRTSFIQNTSEGLMVGEGILKGAPNKVYKNGETIFCYAYTNNKYIKDKHGRQYKIWYYMGEQPRATGTGSDWNRRMGLVK